MDIRANGDTDDLAVKVYNNEGVIEATERVVYTDDTFSVTREGSILVTTTGEFTADTTVLDVMITWFNDRFEVWVVGDNSGRSHTTRVQMNVELSKAIGRSTN